MYPDKSAFQEICTRQAPVVVMLLASIREARTEATRKAASSVLYHLVRELEDHCPRNVSQAAHGRALDLGVGDLRRFHYDDQGRQPLKPHAKVFLWEHFHPVSQLTTRLQELAAPSAQGVVEVMKRSRIVWVLREEDARLPKSYRPDPSAAYAEAGVQLQFPWEDEPAGS
jgi:hypothetical protein